MMYFDILHHRSYYVSCTRLRGYVLYTSVVNSESLIMYAFFVPLSELSGALSRWNCSDNVRKDFIILGKLPFYPPLR